MAGGKIIPILTVISSLVTAALAAGSLIQESRAAAAEHESQQQPQIQYQEGTIPMGIQYVPCLNPIPADGNYQQKLYGGNMMNGYYENNMNPAYVQYMQLLDQLRSQDPIMAAKVQVYNQLQNQYTNPYVTNNNPYGFVSLNQNQYQNQNPVYYQNQYANPYANQYYQQPVQQNPYPQVQPVQYGYGYDDTPSAPVNNGNWASLNPSQNVNPTPQPARQYNMPTYDYGYGYSDPNQAYFQSQYQTNQPSVYTTSNQYNYNSYGYGYGYGYDDNTSNQYQTNNNPYGFVSLNQNNNNTAAWNTGYSNNNNWASLNPSANINNNNPWYNQNQYQANNQNYGYGYGYGYSDPYQNPYQTQQQLNPYQQQQTGYGYGYASPYGTYQPTMMEPGSPSFNHQANVLFGDCDYSRYNNQLYYQQQQMEANRRRYEEQQRMMAYQQNQMNQMNQIPHYYPPQYQQAPRQPQQMMNPGNPDYVIRQPQVGNWNYDESTSNVSELDKLFGTNPTTATAAETKETVKVPGDSGNRSSDSSNCSEISFDALLKNTGPVPSDGCANYQKNFTSPVAHDDVDWYKVAQEAKARVAAENAERDRRHPIDVKQMIANFHKSNEQELIRRGLMQPEQKSEDSVESVSDGKVLTENDIEIPEGAVNAFAPPTE